jgi:hypothetical protein
MGAKIAHLDKLMEILAEKTKQPLTQKGYERMSDALGGEHVIRKAYLYDNISRKKKEARARGEEEIDLQISKLDLIAKYIGYSSYRQFTEQIDTPLDPVLLSCVGNYYSYVRRNDKQGVVLQSPVQINEAEGKVWFELKGPSWMYKGEVRLVHGCLFILMESEGGKIIHHIYKIGVRKKPRVLQGIFSGVSTTFDPIGGRAVLIRSEDKLNKMNNAALTIEALKTSDDGVLRSVGSYFLESVGNNIEINSIGMSFEPGDLLNAHPVAKF